MSPKFVLAVLFCLVAGNSGYTYENDIQYQQRSLADQFEKIMDQIAELIDAGVDAAFSKFEDILNGMIDLGASIMKTTRYIIREAFEATMDVIKPAISEAEIMGIDVGECLGSNWDAMMDVPTKAMNSCEKCIDKNIEESRGIMTKALEEIKSVINVKAIWDDFKSCSGLTAPLCWTRVIAETTVKFASLPIKITAETVKGTAALLAKQAELAVCKTKAVAQSAKETADYSYVIMQCIEKKIEEHNQSLMSNSRFIAPRIIHV